ncbi:MAG: rRNA pseudouridine synthase [Oscillospiraceae bacterium]|jgi:16S rRNA pseudouridine516 synthase|nr:rRNA pseudouridine synthase [Oscillospiraceae bacterium]
MERIDKLIASQGTLSRNDVKKLIREGLVTCNGAAVSSGAQKIDPQNDSLALGGKPLTLSSHIYLMLNKPKNVVSSTETGGQATVMDLVPEEFFRGGLFPAGRLDKDTTGFVLITDDGAFAHSILSPKRHVPKTYEVTVPEPLTQAEIQEIKEGLTVGATRFRPAELRFLHAGGEGQTYEIVLHEGKYHQIKRMFARFKKEVIALHRTKIGALPLDASLAPGECRPLSQAETALLQQEQPLP